MKAAFESVNLFYYLSENFLECGRNTELDGTQAANPEVTVAPWMASLMGVTSDGERRPLCGGALVSREFVVTTAHCVELLER